MRNEQLETEIDRNYDYFQSQFNSFSRQQAGRVAVIRQRNIIGFFESPGEAIRFADLRFPDGLYSVQPVEADPIDLGIFSGA